MPCSRIGETRSEFQWNLKKEAPPGAADQRRRKDETPDPKRNPREAGFLITTIF